MGGLNLPGLLLNSVACLLSLFKILFFMSVDLLLPKRGRLTEARGSILNGDFVVFDRETDDGDTSEVH
jgi:hypothetical protein